jgi:hypothetical protein
MQKVSGFGYQEKNMKEQNMNDVYNIKHCVWCGKKGFDTTEDVIKHIKEKHTRQV